MCPLYCDRFELYSFVLFSSFFGSYFFLLKPTVSLKSVGYIMFDVMLKLCAACPARSVDPFIKKNNSDFGSILVGGEAHN